MKREISPGVWERDCPWCGRSIQIDESKPMVFHVMPTCAGFHDAVTRAEGRETEPELRPSFEKSSEAS